jgi:hypothetical protein
LSKPKPEQFRMSATFQIRRARVIAVSQVSLAIPTETTAETFERVRLATLDWMAARAGKPLPKEAWSGAAFDLQDIGAQRTSAVSLIKPQYWAARLDDADKNVAQRVWVTEIGIATNKHREVLFGTRLYCVALGDSPPFDHTVPAFVRKIVSQFSCLIDGRPVSFKPWIINSPDDVRSFVELLRDRARRLPIVAVSETEDGETHVDANALATKLLGTAHVAKISHDAGFALSDEVGKEFSVFEGAVRSYRPRFDPDSDEPSVHPLALATSIDRWPDGGAYGFEAFLTSRSIQQSVMRQGLDRELPAFLEVQSLAKKEVIATAREAGRSEAELLELAMEEVRQLTKQAEDEKKTLTGLLEEAERERDVAVSNASSARTEAANLRARVLHLEHALKERGEPADDPIPVSLDDLEDWARSNLAGSVFLLNRALRAVKKSGFQDVELVYKCLLLLRDTYVPMRRGGVQDAKAQYESGLSALGLEESASFAGGRAGEYGDEYFVDFAGRRRELDRHLKGRNSRDIRFGFRLYFFWDDESQQVVIGWLPSHLTTRAS